MFWPYIFQHIITDQATNPSIAEEDSELISSFCDQVNIELEGPQIALPLIAHKIQSPQQQEALLALAVIFIY